MNKFYGMLGIARKAGKVILGYDTTVSLIKSSSKNILVVIASDASEKTKKNIVFECERVNCEFLEYGEKVVYGKILNKKEVSVLAVTDKNIIPYLKNNT
ncbi:ribosomal L7Ae/L30e/S12e/Gadd45 family protein [Sedimentibacter sp. zth1]|uniref:L7Ae/L30e/S12e/Gadd45 family ribosomal protein n=1 Tax=Sedimentibacter sp. zth1 TaxID=2816908 RepID=UPI001A9274AA|nr:ribosomal L7Ae/L30e/S12e/Gadd45 family protein [Sedimentibacter sp. zth1]QSX06546.1 ribosomal L7Ae/L30e/S12e/Gadd45 family protein [Sedimentibacter sp. zth1]